MQSKAQYTVEVSWPGSSFPGHEHTANGKVKAWSHAEAAMHFADRCRAKHHGFPRALVPFTVMDGQAFYTHMA